MSTPTPLEQEKIAAEIAKLMAETAKLNKETFWYPLVMAVGLIGGIATATVAIVKLFAA